MVHAAWLRGLPPRPFFLGTTGWGPPSGVLEARGRTHLASMLLAASLVRLSHLAEAQDRISAALRTSEFTMPLGLTPNVKEDKVACNI